LFASEISGKITFDKKLSKRTVAITPYDMRGVAVPDDPSIGHSPSEFARIAVWLESPSAPAAAPVIATLQQRNRHFEPELLVIPAGSTVLFPNLDPIFHNIFSLSRIQSFDLGYYAEGRSRSVKFPKPGIVQVYCHVHPDMHAVIVAVPTVWSAKPREDGTFAWSDLPPGKYKLQIWQSSMGIVHRIVTLTGNGNAHVDISLPKEDPGN
jgi:plastocyanin